MKNDFTIKAIALERLNNDEYAQFIKGVLNLVVNATLEKLAVSEELFEATRKNLELLTEASRQSRLSQETERIVQIDRQRSDVLLFLLSSFRFEQKNVEETRKEAASILYKEFKNYVGTQSLPTRQKSQAIDAFLKDLNKAQFETHIRTLGLQKSVKALVDYNQEYQRLVEGRAENQIANTLINVKKTRKDTNPLYKEIIKYAYSMNVIHPSVETANFIVLLNKLIDDTMSANKQRISQLTTSKAVVKKETL